MKILISSSIKEPHKNQFEYNCDIKLIELIYFIYGKKTQIYFFHKKILNKPDLIIMSGGNNIPKYAKSKSDSLRNEKSNYIYNYAKRKKIPLIGICYGAQFIGFKNKFTFKKKSIIKYHGIMLNKKHQLFKKKNIQVNSFKNIIISKTNYNFNNIYFAQDKSIECFVGKKYKFLGIMWHPERYSKFKTIDKKIFRKFYDSYNVMCR